MTVRLYGYWRSSSSYRVRIALNLKKMKWEHSGVHLVHGEQHEASYRVLNPLGVVPTLDVDGRILTQSPAILEYLDEVAPDPPLLPETPEDRALVRAMAATIGCDIHPIANLSVLDYLRDELDRDDADVTDWVRHWVVRGLTAVEAMAAKASGSGRFCFGDAVSMADVYLVPQMYNARRFQADLSATPTLVEIDRALQALPAFKSAAPERQPDAF